MKRPPFLLVIYTIAYLAFPLWEIAADYEPATLGRLVIDLVLLFFVFRGSRFAGNILAVFCAITTLVLLIVAIAIFNADTPDAVLLAINSGLILAFATYLFFSPAVRKFQGKALPAAAK